MFRRVAAIAAFLLVSLLAPSALAENRTHDHTRTGGYSPQASGILDWTTVGASSWFGAPAPTVNCVAAGTQNRTNSLKNSDDPTASPWRLYPGSNSTITKESAACPVDPNTGRRMVLVTTDSPGGLDGYYYGEALAGNFSAWMSTATGDPQCTGVLADGYNGNRWPFTLTAVPVRHSVTLGNPNTSLPWLTTYQVGNCARWCTGSPQVESGVSVPSDYCGPTGATAKTCGGDLICSGATVTKHGTPTTGSAYAVPPAPSVVLNGSTDWYDLGATGNHTGSFSGCAEFTTNAVDSATHWIVAKDINQSSQPSWEIQRYASTLYFMLFKTPSSYSSIALNVLNASDSNVMCWAFEYLGDGTSKLRLNVNGYAPVEVVNAVGPAGVSTAPLAIGAGGTGGYPWNGSISRVTDWDGWAPTTAQLAAMVASQQAKLTKKPQGGLVSFTSDGGLCCPASDAQCYWLPPNVPCVTTAGAVINRASSNALAYSGIANWDKTSTVVANAAIGPDGAMTAASVTNGNNNYLSFTSAYTCAIWLKAGTATTVTIADNSLGHTCGIDLTTKLMTPGGAGTVCTVTAAAAGGWNRYSIYHPAGLSSLLNVLRDGQPTTLYVGNAQCESGGPLPTLDHATAGTAFNSGIPTATHTATTLTDPTHFVVGWKGHSDAWNESRLHTVWSIGQNDIANSSTLWLVNNQFQIYAYDGAGLYKYWICNNPLPASADATIIAEVISGAATLKINGTPTSCAPPVGPGSGIPAALLSTVYVNISADSVSYGLPATVSKFCQANTLAAVQRCLNAQ